MPPAIRPSDLSHSLSSLCTSVAVVGVLPSTEPMNVIASSHV